MHQDIQNILSFARQTQEGVAGLRRNLHRRPELRYSAKETRTAIRCAFETAKPKDSTAELWEYTGGIVVNVPASLQYRTTLERWAFRSDFDALPLHEATGLSFASEVEGVMHACGHDGHTAMMITAMKAVLFGEVNPNKDTIFLFQDAEENPNLGKSGGKSLVENGVLKGVDRIFGLHLRSDMKSGVFYSRPGPMMGNSDRIHVKVKTPGGHAMEPHNGSSATDVIADVIVGLRALRTALVPAGEHAIIVPGPVKAGDLAGSNVRPSEAKLWLNARSFYEPMRREEFLQAVMDGIERIVATYPDATCEVTPAYGHPSLHNNADEVLRVVRLLGSAGLSFQECLPELGGEDFAWYLEACGGIPGAFFHLGASNGGGAHHTPTFDWDESVLWRGIAFWLLLATA